MTAGRLQDYFVVVAIDDVNIERNIKWHLRNTNALIGS